MSIDRFSSDSLWVTPPPAERRRLPGSNEWFAFRNVLSLASDDAAEASLKIAADSKYVLYVNGKLVVRDGGLKRGPTPGGGYFDEVSLSGLVRAGENTLAVLLWFFGRHGFSHRDSGEPGLLVEASRGTLGAWKTRAHPAYFDAGYIHDAYRLPENSIGFDARHDLPGWILSDYDDARWPAAEVCGGDGSAPWGAQESRPFPDWFWSEPKEYVSVVERPGDARDGFAYFHCRLPHNAQIVPLLTVEAEAGIRISVTSGQDTGRFNATYITKGGVQSHEFMGWINGEEVIYKIPSEAVRVVSLQYRETGFPAAFRGHFECGDPLLDGLWEKARRTLYVTMRDTFMDCPCRERAQWPGDMVVQAGQAPYCLDRTADRLARKGFREFFRWQRSDGTLYGPLPAGNWEVELPAQMLAVASPFGLWNHYMQTGERDLLEESYPRIRRYLDVWETESNGTMRYRPRERNSLASVEGGIRRGVWDWVDWGERIDAEPAQNAWYALALEGARLTARELGLAEEAESLLQRKRDLIEAIRKVYWCETRGGFVSPDFEHLPDDRVQALMVLGGIAEPAEHPALRTVFETVEEASPYMETYVLAALFAMGEPELGLKRMRSRYRAMTENENSTLWERWPNGSEHPGTINHSWSGGPLTLLGREIAGLHPVEPGWTKFAFRPRPLDLKKVSCSLRSPLGTIAAECEWIDGEWRVELTVPEGSVAVVDLAGVGLGSEVVEVEGTGKPKAFGAKVAL